MLRSTEHDRIWSRLFRNHNTPFTHNRPLHIMIIVFMFIWVLTAIHPVDLKDWIVENVPLILFIGGLAFLYRTFAFSNLSYLLIMVFLVLHAIGAHYAYQHSPIDSWFKTVFHTKRGVYDRIVHLAFGLLIVYPTMEITVRIMKLRSVWSYVVTFGLIMASAAFFEIAEMLVVTLLANPKLAAKYLGFQGDPMDTQKDMLMAMIGAILAIGVIGFLQYRRSCKRK
ncbi:DUF2238 domain-containing protein [Paenibacillus psychroresistens]|uniref:DUF2238 domain-containing protein n=1 Tax=Paenibacillus psychroresistens TaxID=1778678 RepID=A0A6B8RT64_9BACL|nr:DUF2238 domain-containing protein [Paenibacillus psychroresistens]QGQ98984.1 DUF2238 domain-containing protein [Paenibacillus psychroresistens]